MYMCNLMGDSNLATWKSWGLYWKQYFQGHHRFNFKISRFFPDHFSIFPVFICATRIKLFFLILYFFYKEKHKLNARFPLLLFFQFKNPRFYPDISRIKKKSHYFNFPWLWEPRLLNLPTSNSGRLNSTFLSSLPGRHSAGSSVSGLLVAMRTLMLPRGSNPSSWLINSNIVLCTCNTSKIMTNCLLLPKQLLLCFVWSPISQR